MFDAGFRHIKLSPMYTLEEVKAAVEEAGGWSHDTLSEDLDLVLRTHLKGWGGVFLMEPHVVGELPQKLGDYTVTTYADAKTILSGMGCGSVGRLNCMAGMLLAAELNLQQGGNTCIQGVVDQANTLLKKYNYSGFKPYSISAADSALAQTLHDQLSAYNIDGVPTC
jgi:hypothetical protein